MKRSAMMLAILPLVLAATEAPATTTIDNPFSVEKDDYDSGGPTTNGSSTVNSGFGSMKGDGSATGLAGTNSWVTIKQHLGGTFDATADETYIIEAKGDCDFSMLTNAGGKAEFTINLAVYNSAANDGGSTQLYQKKNATGDYGDPYQKNATWKPEASGTYKIFVTTHAHVQSNSATSRSDIDYSSTGKSHFLDWIKISQAETLECTFNWSSGVSFLLPFAPGLYVDPFTQYELSFELNSVNGFAGAVNLSIDNDSGWISAWFSDDIVFVGAGETVTVFLYVENMDSSMGEFWNETLVVQAQPVIAEGGRDNREMAYRYPLEVQGGPLPDKYRTAQDVVGVFESDAQWGDLDGDGDHDLVLCGESDAGLVTLVYRNDVDSLLALPNALPGISGNGSGPLALGDVDLDGDLDLALAGMGDAGRIAELWLGDGTGLFTVDGAQSLLPVNNASLAWADVDLDGDLDLYLHGYDGAAAVAKLYLNDAGLLIDSGQALTGHYGGSADFGDYDGDGDFDLVVTGNRGGGVRGVVYYENDPTGTLTADGDHGLPGLGLSDVAAGDYDLDGDLDLVVTGEDGTNRMTRVYGNDGSGNFAQAASVLDVYRSAVAWGDADADGDLDLAVLGYTGTQLHTKLFENDAGGFVEVQSWTGVREGSMSFVDADEDGDLDLFVTGADWSTNYAQLEKRTWGADNIPPHAPVPLNGEHDGHSLNLSWTAGSDDHTPTSGLYYTLRVGTNEGDDDVFAGTYASPLLGNVGQALSLSLDVPNQEYHWSVRTVDAGLAASSWSEEQIVVSVLGGMPAPTRLVLEGNVPNPFNPWTAIGFTLPPGSPRAVTLSIYDAAGRLVRTLVNGTLVEGQHARRWDGLDDRGREVPSGVYFYRAESAGEATARRMTLLR